MTASNVITRYLETLPYETVWRQMQTFTEQRRAETLDEFWVLQHFPVFTQGQAGRPEHVLMPGDIPVVQSDRGGQVTYHGPGQLMIYILCDLKRDQWTVRQLVCHIEKSVIRCLSDYGIVGHTQPKAPGVYVDGAKICSLGLRIRRGCSYHGLSLNVNMDLEPFQRINPCGFVGLKMVQMADFIQSVSVDEVGTRLVSCLLEGMGHMRTVRCGSQL